MIVLEVCLGMVFPIGKSESMTIFTICIAIGMKRCNRIVIRIIDISHDETIRSGSS